jgi:hypothetical protein
MTKNDSTAKAIVEALRKAGAVVEYWVPSARQKGLPDLVVGYKGETYLLEVKASDGRVSAAQAAWHATWQGGPIATVFTVEGALVAIGAM